LKFVIQSILFSGFPGHNAFQIIHVHTTVVAHTLWALTAATILADAAVTPPSPK